MRIALFPLLAALTIAACSDAPHALSFGDPAAGGSTTNDAGARFGDDGGSFGSPADGDAGGGGDDASVANDAGARGDASAPRGLATVGTLVVLGDSIGDGGGQPPFYYDLLHQDLTTKYGAIGYHRNAQSGSTTSALAGQVDALPATLAGPVVVTITSGGNDMKAALGAILAGADSGPRADMQANVKRALDKLGAPGRFGAGVAVYVFEGNIYDASDGHGDFGQHACNFGQGVPTTPSDGHFADWNLVITNEIAAHAQTLSDMHATFYGHGYHAAPDWYASDCTHPSQIGHDQLRRLFYAKITGQPLP